MSPRILIWHSTGSTTVRDAVRTAFGISDLAFTAFDGVHFIEVRPRCTVSNNEWASFCKNYQSIITAGGYVQIRVSTANESLATLRAGFAGSAGIDAGSTAPLYVTGTAPASWVNMVFDARTTGREAFITLDQAENKRFVNCIIFEPQGLAPDRDELSATDSNETEHAMVLSRSHRNQIVSCWFGGGKAYGHLGIIRGNSNLVDGCVFAGDARMRWGFCDVMCGDPWDFPDTCARYGYVFDGGRRPFRHGTNLRGNMGTREDIRLVNNAGGTARVRLDWTAWNRSGTPVTRDQVDNHQGSWLERNVWLDWQGAPDGLTFHWISVDYAAKTAVVEARQNGAPFTIPAGYVGWHTYQTDYSPMDNVFVRCTWIGLSAADRPRLQGISLYNAMRCMVLWCQGGNVGDYVVGLEADCVDCIVAYCVDLGGTAGSAFEIVFAGWGCQLLYNWSATQATYALGWGFPQVRCVFEGIKGLVDDRHTATTIPSTRSRTTNMWRASRLNRAAINPAFVAVSPANLTGQVPATSAPS